MCDYVHIMKRLLIVLAVSTLAPAQMKDFEGHKDPALFTRMPRTYLAYPGSVEVKQFDLCEFQTGNGPADKQRVEGRWSKYTYHIDPDLATPPSGLQIIRNYQAAVKRIDGKVLWEDEYGNRTTLLVAKDGAETWADVYAGNGLYWLTIVEREAMKQDVIADAAAFQSGLVQSGHVAVPGIFFDFGKAEVKPESEPALKEVAKLLQANPALKVWVVGHTDNVGAPEANLKLSAARAAAVIEVLTRKMSVPAAQLASFGAGPFAPVASNSSEEGRVKNRRVELVARD